MGCRLFGRRPTFMLMMFLTTTFFLVEIVVGYITNSMALIADSFHMLSDIISLVVGYFALKLSRKTSEHLIVGNTFGWVRAEVLGALVNAVFLLALCLSILISALKRVVEPEPLHNPILILIVGGVGLVVNLLGMLLFHGHASGHGHSHGGGHGHSHGGGHGHSHGGEKGHNHGDEHDHYVRKDVHNAIENGKPQVVATPDGNLAVPITIAIPPPSPSLSMSRYRERASRVEVILNPEVALVTEDSPEVSKERHPAKTEGQLNMRGVYLHILGDALGSLIVIISALIVRFVKHKWTLYVDPVMSIIMVAIILYSSVPLLKESSRILLQNVPSHIQLKQLEARLLDTFPEIIGIHEFHVWQLAGNKIIASVHVKFNSNTDYNRLSSNLKEFFHFEGIHSTTFQPEFEEESQKSLKQCLLACESKSCQEKLCCSSNSLDKAGSDDELLANEHAVPKTDIRITLDGDNFHIQESSSFYRDETSSYHAKETCSGKEGNVCVSRNCLNKSPAGDELHSNKHAGCCDTHEHAPTQSETSNISDSPAVIESTHISNESNII